MKFNTAIAAMMALMNRVYEVGTLTRDELDIFARLLCPFAPHVSEEVYEWLGHTDLCSLASFPTFDESKTVDKTVEIVVQVLGKLRGTVTVPADAAKEEIIEAAKKEPKVASSIEGKTVVKEIYVPGKLVNLVVR